MRVTILGSGTSHGIPVVGCGCPVCRSEDPKDIRSRASILIEHNGSRILVDTSTDFRTQAIREGIDRIDAILVTHTHADHLHGLDDIRSLSREKPIPLYASAPTLEEIRSRFAYIFRPTQIGGGKPNIDLRLLDGDWASIAGVDVLPVPIKHGDLDIYGFRVGAFAYLTDCSGIPATSFDLLRDIDVLIIGALRYRPHATHFTIAEAVEAAERIGAGRVWLTHMCHDVTHAILNGELHSRDEENPAIEPGYDGLVIEV